jgi:hypothetical protein
MDARSGPARIYGSKGRRRNQVADLKVAGPEQCVYRVAPVGQQPSGFRLAFQGGLLNAQPIRHFRDPQMSRPSRAIQRRTTRLARADNSTMCLPDALELPCCRVR